MWPRLSWDLLHSWSVLSHPCTLVNQLWFHFIILWSGKFRNLFWGGNWYLIWMTYYAGAKLPLYAFGVRQSSGSNKRAHTGSDDHCVPDSVKESDVSPQENYFLDELLLAQVGLFCWRWIVLYPTLMIFAGVRVYMQSLILFAVWLLLIGNDFNLVILLNSGRIVWLVDFSVMTWQPARLR